MICIYCHSYLHENICQACLVSYGLNVNGDTYVISIYDGDDLTGGKRFIIASPSQHVPGVIHYFKNNKLVCSLNHFEWIFPQNLKDIADRLDKLKAFS